MDKVKRTNRVKVAVVYNANYGPVFRLIPRLTTTEIFMDSEVARRLFPEAALLEVIETGNPLLTELTTEQILSLFNTEIEVTDEQ